MAKVVNEVEILSAPLNTTVLLVPMLSENVELSWSGFACVVEKLNCALGRVRDKGPPASMSGRRRISLITIGYGGNSDAA